MPSWNMISLQDPTSLPMMSLNSVHDLITQIMVMITIFIIYVIIYLLSNKLLNKSMMNNNILELMWTIIPMIMLIGMATPSLKLLYLMEDSETPYISVKTMGHQWYWSYEYSDFNKSFNSFMYYSDTNNFRSLDVDTRMILPYNITSRIICSSSDVIHSWTIPSMGLKTDAIPGRMNQLLIKPILMGMFFGQCSEICGMNHSFMPIVLEISPSTEFIKWLKTIET
uniref:Cytochrome c oxidase subunit 2 n=1 Tax=Mutilla europaea TaxID=2749339 RepID=A0A7L7S0Z4_9HYME|nr:cytochrome c oxidase subunit II [Mutilla europaea]